MWTCTPVTVGSHRSTLVSGSPYLGHSRRRGVAAASDPGHGTVCSCRKYLCLGESLDKGALPRVGAFARGPGTCHSGLCGALKIHFRSQACSPAEAVWTNWSPGHHDTCPA